MIQDWLESTRECINEGTKRNQKLKKITIWPSAHLGCGPAQRSTTRGIPTRTPIEKNKHFLQHMKKHRNNEVCTDRSRSEGKKISFAAGFQNITRRIAYLGRPLLLLFLRLSFLLSLSLTLLFLLLLSLSLPILLSLPLFLTLPIFYHYHYRDQCSYHFYCYCHYETSDHKLRLLRSIYINKLKKLYDYKAGFQNVTNKLSKCYTFLFASS